MRGKKTIMLIVAGIFFLGGFYIAITDPVFSKAMISPSTTYSAETMALTKTIDSIFAVLGGVAFAMIGLVPGYILAWIIKSSQAKQEAKVVESKILKMIN